MVIPPWLLRFVPYGLVIAAVLGGVLYIDHRGYQRARRDAEMDRRAQIIEFQQALRDSEKRMAGVIDFNDHNLADQLDRVRTYHSTVVQPAIEREIAHDPLLARSDARLTDSLWRELNAARTGSACASQPDGRIICTLPAAVATPRPVGGNAGTHQP